MRWIVVVFVLVTVATPAAAQSTYVGASLVGDLARFSKIDYDSDEPARILVGQVSQDGEAIGFNVKVGRNVGERWGLEFEFARTGEFESRSSMAIPALRPERLDLRVPPFEFESERTHTMYGVLAFIRQELGDHVDLSYLAGISFNRTETEQEYTGPRILIYPPVSVPDIETIDYTVGPAVGAEAAIKFGSAAVTAGLRLQSVRGSGSGGWLIRPNVGMRWTF